MKNLNLLLSLSFISLLYACGVSKTATDTVESTEEVITEEVVEIEEAVEEEITIDPSQTVIEFKANMFKAADIPVIYQDLKLTIVDNEGSKFFGNDTDELWLYPAKLKVNLNPKRSVKKITIDYVDSCRDNCTMAKTYNSAGEEIESIGNSTTNVAASFVFEKGLENCTYFTVSSFEGVVNKITIDYNI